MFKVKLPSIVAVELSFTLNLLSLMVKSPPKVAVELLPTNRVPAPTTEVLPSIDKEALFSMLISPFRTSVLPIILIEPVLSASILELVPEILVSPLMVKAESESLARMQPPDSALIFPPMVISPALYAANVPLRLSFTSPSNSALPISLNVDLSMYFS